MWSLFDEEMNDDDDDDDENIIDYSMSL